MSLTVAVVPGSTQRLGNRFPHSTIPPVFGLNLIGAGLKSSAEGQAFCKPISPSISSYCVCYVQNHFLKGPLLHSSAEFLVASSLEFMFIALCLYLLIIRIHSHDETGWP